MGTLALVLWYNEVDPSYWTAGGNTNRKLRDGLLAASKESEINSTVNDAVKLKH